MKNYIFATLLFATLCRMLFASSGESEMIYEGDGKYRATRPLWANAYAPNTPENNAGGVNDLNPGDVFPIGPLIEATSVIINGFPSNVETYETNLQKGDRILVRNERRWVQLLNLQTSNFFDEGVMEKVAKDGSSVTIKFYTNLPSGRVASESREFKVKSGMVIRLEGRDASWEEALKPGRHLRIYRPRPQVVLASDEIGRKDTRSVRGRGMRRIFSHGGLPDRTAHSGNQPKRREGRGKVGNLRSLGSSLHGSAYAGVQDKG